MKSIKTTFIRGLSLLLTLVLLLNLPISAFAAVTIPDWNATYTYNYDAERQEMIDSPIFRALKYLGYDSSNELANKGYLFNPEYSAGRLLRKYENGQFKNNPFTGIPYADLTYGTATTKDAQGNTIPDVEAFRSGGLVCNSFIEYYYFNYLRNIEKVNVNYLINAYYAAADRIGKGTYKYGIDAWYEMAETLVAEGTHAKAYYFEPEDSVIPTSGSLTEGQQKYLKLFDRLPIGSLIRFGYPDYGRYNDEFKHYAIYAGTANGVHYIIHIPNHRGPEISIIENMIDEDDSKRSYPLAFYLFKDTVVEENYGSITIYKDDPEGKPLAGATFLVTNVDTGEVTEVTTGSDGYARLKDLLLGNYTIVEFSAPDGYEKVDTIWKVKLTEEDPTGGGTIHVTNTPKKGSLKIIKNILPSSAATSGNLIGWQFNIYKNSPTFTTTIRDGVIYRVKVTDKNGNFIYSDPAELMVAEKETVEKPPIEITAQPSNVALSSGSTASFTVAAKSNTGKTLTYQWYYKNPTATSWSKSTSTSATTATYSLSINSDRDGRGAMCLISDGTNEVWSDPAYMYLTGSLGVSKNPGNQTAAYGATATFSATYYGTPTGYTWQYSADGNTWTNCSNAPFSCTGYNTASLKVTSAQAINGYQFRCVVTNGSKTYQTLGATLTAIPAYISFISPSASALVNIGQSQSFYVGVSGADLTYQWQIWTAETGEWADLEGMVSSGMTLTMTKEYSNSKVRVVVTQGTTVLHSNAITFATPNSLCITKQPIVAAGEAGKEVTMSVTANGDGLVYQWEMYDAATDKWISVDQQFGGTYTTDGKGVVQVNNLPIGDYYVVEIDTGREGWGYDLTPKAVTVTEDNTAELPYEVTITNQLLQGSVSIDKLTEDGENYDGWKFAIYADAECTILVDDDLTDEDGYWLFDGLAPGTYWVKELGHVDPAIDELYYCASENPQMVTVEPGKTTWVEFENELNRGVIEIIKKGNNDKLLSGAVFEATDSKGNVYTFTESAENPGHYYLSDVFFGTFTVTEITPPEGYEIGEQDTWTVTLSKASPNGMATITIINDEILGSLSIKKDTEDGKNLEGWLFNVYADADCSVLLAGNLKTDDKGFITVPGLKPGTVWVREEGHVDTDIADLYYCNSTNPQSAEIKGHETATVTFENNLRFGSIEIIKISIEGTPLSGAKFLLEWSEDGSMWEKVTYNTTDHITKGTCTSNGLTDGCLITDSTGIIAFTGLHPKLYYRITELEAPEGYLLLTDYVYTGQLPEDTLKLDFTVVNAKIFELPKTGSTSMTLMPVALLLSTATCVGVLLYLRKKKES